MFELVTQADVLSIQNFLFKVGIVPHFQKRQTDAVPEGVKGHIQDILGQS